MKLLLLKGLPASGKSTFAKELTKDGWIRVNKDDIRSQLFGNDWKQKYEKLVIKVRDLIIREALTNNKNVVSDDTNLNPVHIEVLKKLAEEFKAEFEINDTFLTVPLEACIQRDLKRANSVGERVIRQMYNQYINQQNSTIEFNDSLSYAVLVDVDGTLSHIQGTKKRSPYDWHRVGEDSIDPAVAFFIDALNETNQTKVFLLSGRDSVCRAETEEWLERNDINYDSLFMRPEGDNRKDTVIKQELYEEHIKDKYNVLSVIDDRPSVVRMWQSLGLKTFIVGDPWCDF